MITDEAMSDFKDIWKDPGVSAADSRGGVPGAVHPAHRHLLPQCREEKVRRH